MKMLEGGHQDSHCHPGGWLSGVVYLKTIDNPLENEGAIELGLHGFNYPVLKADFPSRLHQPRDGDIILFPSSLLHRTVPVKSAKERCVIAFDLIQREGFSPQKQL